MADYRTVKPIPLINIVRSIVKAEQLRRLHEADV